MSSYFLPRIYFGACLTFATILLFSFWSRTFLSEHFPMKSVTKSVQDVNSLNGLVLSNYSDNTKNDTAMKYILLYTNPRYVPFVYMGVGRKAFIDKSCPYTNCIVTGDKKYFNDITKFDVIAFSGPEILKMPNSYLPTARSPHQKYVFASIESSHYYPSCSNRFDGVFNWTWTFRLDSDVRWGYMLIRDSDDNIIGPNKIMHWTKVEDMAPVSKEFEEKLKSKTKAVAWFVSNCYDLSGRLRFAHDLLDELKKYDLELDIFGRCGPKSCPTDKHDKCMKMVEKSYYFYLSFENSFSEDYVTEKLLQALKINVVPVVYGAANYTRFMPDGIYLNAREFSAQELAAKMNELIKDPGKYASYFKWKKYYSYHSKHEVPETNEYCKMCEILNNENEMKKTTIIQNFRDWWDKPKTC